MTPRRPMSDQEESRLRRQRLGEKAPDELVTVDRRSLMLLVGGLGAIILALVGLGVWSYLTGQSVNEIKAVVCGQHVVPVTKGVVARSQESRIEQLCGVRVARGPRGEVGFIGPPGPRGLPGAQGGTGPRGSVGPRGVAGPRGAIGAPGPRGNAGVTGALGPRGARGPLGAVGPTGAPGGRGAVGPPGARGATGSSGPQGLRGLVGPAGATGPPGARGLQGVLGPIGPIGPSVSVGEVVAQVCARLPIRC